ncbi:dr1-associated corepressor isoform X3 [Rousettus aegyptiacus]|uniref:Dr1-associated corepressor n=1 Tax=Rousettus aegyptiacus TaxID=9407 RepID=A0A7J8GYF0_ROUAE|nr:dr1-associated corepressor isoform X3 [Rousettus aegyptiacus]KAF6464890.1 DR1 associated protein 1 [Rousettus aegyptiacus]
MPSKKKKYNARFPPARIKKIMQTDEEIGKVAAAVPVIISRALELFLESLLKKACQVTQSRNAKTMTTSHLKQCIEQEQQFDFLKDLVASVPDMQGDGEDNHMDGDKGARRMSLRTPTLMEKKRRHRRHPRLATPPPTFRAPQHLSCPSPRLCLCPQHPRAPQHLMQRTKKIMTPSALCPPGHIPF